MWAFGRSLRVRGLVAAVLLVLGTFAVAGPPAAQPARAAPPSSFRVFQTNMCMWGTKYYLHADKEHEGEQGTDTCFPNRYVSVKDSKIQYADGWEAEERTIGGQKRQSMVDVLNTYQPDAMTVNEGCEEDIAAVAQATGYTYQKVDLGGGQGRQCTPNGERGVAVNAVLAKRFQNATPEGGYFQSGGARAWMCSMVEDVRMCTAHLSLPSQGPQPAECNILRARLRDRSARPTIFAGDTNYNHTYDKTNCMPTGFYGLQDIEYQQKPNAQSGMQQIYYSDDLTRNDTCGHMPEVAHTDHQGFWIDLHPAASPTRGAACTWRDVRPPGVYPDKRWLHGYSFHQEAQAGWTATASARLALTMQAQEPWQADLHAELGDTPSVTTLANVLNDHIAADGGPRYYKGRTSVTTAGLKSDVKYDFIRDFAVIARVQGTVTDTENRTHTAASPSYIAVVGYYDGGDRVTVENVAAERDDLNARRWNVTTANLAKWISGGYTA